MITSYEVVMHRPPPRTQIGVARNDSGNARMKSGALVHALAYGKARDGVGELGAQPMRLEGVAGIARLDSVRAEQDDDLIFHHRRNPLG